MTLLIHFWAPIVIFSLPGLLAMTQEIEFIQLYIYIYIYIYMCVCVCDTVVDLTTAPGTLGRSPVT